MSENLPLHCLFYVTMKNLFLFSMSILHVTSSRFCLYLLSIYHFTYIFSHAHTKAHTYKHTCTICNTRGMSTIRQRSLVERGGRKALLETLHKHKKNGKKCPKNPDIHESQEKIRVHRASCKATSLFLTK